METFGRRVAKCRAELGWTQQALADRLALSRVAVSHIEADMTWPNERTVVLLAGLFRLEPHELVAGTTYPHAKTQRLPAVAARHTEVDHQLALLAADLRWLEVCERVDDAAVQAERRRTVASWHHQLRRLLQQAHLSDERRRVGAALRALPRV